MSCFLVKWGDKPEIDRLGPRSARMPRSLSKREILANIPMALQIIPISSDALFYDIPLRT